MKKSERAAEYETSHYKSERVDYKGQAMHAAYKTTAGHRKWQTGTQEISISPSEDGQNDGTIQSRKNVTKSRGDCQESKVN